MNNPAPPLMRVLVRVSGIVQGVGFRPFVHGLAGSLGLAGFVANDESGVLAEAQGDPAVVHKFTAELSEHPPPLARVERVSVTEVPALAGAQGFVIASSSSTGHPSTLISPDTATCSDCLAELFDPADRRYRYPFVNCTHCGPRYTIVTGVPYDRPATTMAAFPMCPMCATEYHDPADRRFHAQPVCCPDCGPTLTLLSRAGGRLTRVAAADDRVPQNADPVAPAAALLRAGAVLAVKGLGGFHLAALAGGPAGQAAVARLRAAKHREDRPFAVLVRDLDAARELVEVDDVAVELLTSRRRPIVLLRRRAGARVAQAVAPGNAVLGILLPYTPLHHLLAAEVAEPIVLTSGNVSDEPIAYRDDDALTRLAPLADAFLTHDRRIHIRVDDSVLRIVRGGPYPIRRSRGYAPEPLPLAWPARRAVLGCGAELKNTFCLARGGHAFLSPHIGDLENYETLRSYTEGVDHLCTLFDIAPEVVAHDIHPDYLSTSYAADWGRRDEQVELLAVQHHHAHVAACLADNGVAGPVIGLACDGLGFGTDGTLWGGEVLVASLATFRRLAHLEPVAMPGGAAAVREPWRMAAAYLRLAYGPDSLPRGARALINRQGERWDKLAALLDAARLDPIAGMPDGSPPGSGAFSGTLNTPLTSSVGRLFDAVAALVGLRDRANYEGQAAVELEQRVDPDENEWYPVRQEGPLIRGSDLVRGVVDDLGAGIAVPVIAARFHNGLVEALAKACVRARAETSLGVVALSGGVFQNVVLTERLVTRLRADGFAVLTHRRVPCNDAGVSFGQVAVALGRDLDPAGFGRTL